MKQRILLPIFLLLSITAVILTGYFLFYSLPVSSPEKTELVFYKGIALPYGYSNEPILGSPSFTGIIKDYSTEGGKITLRFAAAKKEFVTFQKDEEFTFDPATTLATNNSLKDQKKMEWRVPYSDELKSLLKHSFAATIQFRDLPSDISDEEIKTQINDSEISIIFHTYLDKP